MVKNPSPRARGPRSQGPPAHPGPPFPREEEGSFWLSSPGLSRSGVGWEAKAREGEAEGKEDPCWFPFPAEAGMRGMAPLPLSSAKAGLCDMMSIRLPEPPPASTGPEELCEEERSVGTLLHVWL